MSHNLLAIDVGNTRTKWGVFDGNDWLETGNIANADIRTPEDLSALWKKLPVFQRAVVSNVAGENFAALLKASLAQVPVNMIQSAPQNCGVTNGYENPAQLGSDRWAAIVAAWDLTRAACVVVGAGTALTVDAISPRGEFMGGLISPGLYTMKNSLLANTAGISSVQGDWQSFPINTADAVHTGALTAMAGVVNAMWLRLAHIGARPCLIMTGGDALELNGALSDQAEIRPNLVLEGLILLGREMYSQ